MLDTASSWRKPPEPSVSCLEKGKKASMAGARWRVGTPGGEFRAHE